MDDEQTREQVRDETPPPAASAPRPPIDEDEDEVLEAGPETALMW
jgi:hypothetical protein